jgi:hypothetical protein
MSELAEASTGVYAVPPESIEHWRGAVYFENLALWKETNPQYRANIAKQLAEWTQILADMEAEAAQAAAQGEG